MGYGLGRSPFFYYVYQNVYQTKAKCGNPLPSWQKRKTGQKWTGIALMGGATYYQ